MDHYSIIIGDNGFDEGSEEERGVLIAKAALGTRQIGWMIEVKVQTNDVIAGIRDQVI